MSKSSIAAIAIIAAGLTLSAASADAGPWGASHPRRAEVNGRLAHQHARIRAGVADGQLTHSEAHQLRREDHSVRVEERDMARLDGGHITKTDQRALNQQENTISKQIYAERH